MSVLLALSFLLRVTQVTEAFIYFWTFPVVQSEISLIPVSPSTTDCATLLPGCLNKAFFFSLFFNVCQCSYWQASIVPRAELLHGACVTTKKRAKYSC